nr:hypothetical protein [Rhodopirellula sp. SM50]
MGAQPTEDELRRLAEQGMRDEQTLPQAEQLGFEWEQEDLRQFVKNYVDNHSN